MIRTMELLRESPKSLLELRLTRDLTRIIKRGHPWVFADALRRLPTASPGTPAILLDNKKGRPIALGLYDPDSPLAFRVCDTNPETRLDDSWAAQQFDRALALRQIFVDDATTGYRLFNGEGDGLPGLICDVYNDTAVMQLDGAGPQNFWQPDGIARWIAANRPITQVYLKTQSRNKDTGRALLGATPAEPVSFIENDVKFTVNVLKGQKTGFFLDQRNNRQLIRQIARGRHTLNLFGYTGGFSVYAGLGGAPHVTTVDSAGPALQSAHEHWLQNGLPAQCHRTEKADAFAFLEGAAKKQMLWDLVIVDPPSFAASTQMVSKATGAYRQLFAAATAVTRPGQLLAVASCSSHITLPHFLSICEDAVSIARRRATLLAVKGQPADHPTPLPFSEFRYLKFVLMRVD